jgi:Holliday junction resolvasome RuvABC endonuclease subunit
MIAIGIDPGAERLGWAVIESEGSGKDPKEVAVGIYGLKRHDNGSKEPFQEYRLRLIDYWSRTAETLFEKFDPDQIYNEIVPVVGSGNFVAATQSQLASTALTVIQHEAFRREVPITQIGANTVKKRIGGAKNASKVKVRNGVFQLLPSTERFKKEWVKVHDSSDACAVALCGIGYKI